MSDIRLQCVNGSGTPVFLVNNTGVVTASSAQITNANVTSQTTGTSTITTSLIATGNSNTIGNIFTTGGNVGLGIVPNARLDIRTTDEAQGGLIAQFGGSSVPRIQFYDHAASGGLGSKINFNAGFPGVIRGGGDIGLIANVGIRTNSPGYTLDVNGTMSVRNGNGSGGTDRDQIILGHNGTTSYAHTIKTRHQAGINNADNAFDFYVWQTSNPAATVGNKHIMSVTSVGVGVGTRYPSVGPLHVVTTSGNTSIVIQKVTSGSALLEYYNNGTRTSAIYTPESSNQLRIRMDSVAADVMTFATNGNIGLYTNTPSAAFDIITSNTFGQMWLGNSIQKRKVVLWNDATNEHQFYGFGLDAGVLRYQIPSSGADHLFCAGVSGGVSSNELMRIKGNGNVGINVNPTYKLQISGGSGVQYVSPQVGDIAIPYGNAIRIPYGSVGTKLIEVQWANGFDQTRIYTPGSNTGNDIPKMVIQNNGYVGINTTAPASELDVRGDSIMGYGPGGLATPLMLTNYNVTYGSAMGMAMGQGNQWTRLYSTNVGANTNRFTIDMSCQNSTYSPVLTATNNSAGTIYVGIGTTSPQYTVDVAGTININGFVYRVIGPFGYIAYNGSLGTWYSDTIDYSLYASLRIAAEEFNAYSDQRIKTNVQDVNDDSALQAIRAIQPKRYKYIDTVGRGDQPVWGFIAQQVASVLDYSTNKISDYIPNVYKLVTVTHNTGGSILSSELLDTDILDLVNTKEVDKDGNNKLLKIKIFVKQDEMLEVFVKEIISKTEIQIEDVLDESITQAFFYGQRVNNFHALNKDAIFTVSVAALQEVDRQLQDAKQTIVERQQKIDTLNQRIQNILSRITSL